MHKQVVLVHKIRPLGSESRSLKMYEPYCRNSDKVLTVATMSASESTTNTELRNSTYRYSTQRTEKEMPRIICSSTISENQVMPGGPGDDCLRYAVHCNFAEERKARIQ